MVRVTPSLSKQGPFPLRAWVAEIATILGLAIFASIPVSHPAAAAERCETLLAGPPFAGFDGETTMRISSSIDGEILIGTECSPERMATYFEDRGWDLSLEGPQESYESLMRHGQANYFMSFCLPRAIPLRWLMKRCRATASVHFRDDQLIEIKSANSK